MNSNFTTEIKHTENTEANSMIRFLCSLLFAGEDTVVDGPAGYGTDSADCGGPRTIQYEAGPFKFYPTGRRLQNAGEAYTHPPPPPPPPPPNFSQKGFLIDESMSRTQTRILSSDLV